MAAPPSPDQRRSRRRATAWPARCRTRKGAILDGTIADVSATGAFFGVADQAVAEPLLRRLAVGDQVELGMEGRLLGDREMAATIRWIGFSRAHHSVGFGLELFPGRL